MLDDINGLPDIFKVKLVSQSLAMLDAIIMPEWEFRYFSFDCHWDDMEMMASMKNGSGDEYFLLFNNSGAIGKVFLVNSQLSDNDINKLFARIPTSFQSFKNEEAFKLDNISFCFWRLNTEQYWILEPQRKNLPYLDFLTGDPTLYKKWAEKYYEKNLDSGAIQDIFLHKPLTLQIVSKLNNEISLEDLYEDINEIGYPIKTQFD